MNWTKTQYGNQVQHQGRPCSEGLGRIRRWLRESAVGQGQERWCLRPRIIQTARHRDVMSEDTYQCVLWTAPGPGV